MLKMAKLELVGKVFWILMVNLGKPVFHFVACVQQRLSEIRRF